MQRYWSVAFIWIVMPSNLIWKEERNAIVAANELAYTTLIYLKPFIFHHRTLCCRKPHLDKRVLKISIKDINPYVEDQRKQRLTQESQLTANPKFANLISVVSRCTWKWRHSLCNMKCEIYRLGAYTTHTPTWE